MTTTLTQPAAKPTVGAVLQAGAVGILIAAVLNLLLYFLGTAIGALPAMSSMGQPITLIPVLSFTIGAGIVATLLYLVLTRFLAPGRANAVFLIIASLVLIGMAFTPITSVVDPTVATVLVLETMHLAAALPPMATLHAAEECRPMAAVDAHAAAWPPRGRRPGRLRAGHPGRARLPHTADAILAAAARA